MRRSWPVTCAAVLILGVFSNGCGASGKTASTSSDQGDGVHEYRAVCTQIKLHDGNEIVLTKWLETRAMAQQLGDYHGEFKYKGHVVRIEERVKPKPVEPPR